MKDWSNLTVGPEATIKQAIEIINGSGLAQVALVTDDRDHLVGTVTDGDIRRGLLAGKTFDSLVSEIMHRSFRSVPPGTERSQVWRLMREASIHQVPVVDADGRVCGLYLLDELIRPVPKSTRIVLMAGGRGRRLYPLTKDLPKPLLHIGGRPILETIITNFVDQGFHEFYLSVNYLGHKIRNHFNDGSAWGANIHYLEEEKQLGTAGALSMLPEMTQEPFIVMNGDVITSIDFGNLLKFHEETGCSATICLRDYEVEIPFGVVETLNNQITSIREKPTHSVYVSAGIYVLDPSVLSLVEHGEHLDMPDLLQKLIAAGKPVCPYPIHEYWIDVGRIEEYEKANDDVTENKI